MTAQSVSTPSSRSSDTTRGNISATPPPVSVEFHHPDFSPVQRGTAFLGGESKLRYGGLELQVVLIVYELWATANLHNSHFAYVTFRPDLYGPSVARARSASNAW